MGAGRARARHRGGEPSHYLRLPGHTWDEIEFLEAVWSLYRRFIQRAGPVPTLIERDGNVPSFADLMRERAVAADVLRLAPVGRVAEGTPASSEALS